MPSPGDVLRALASLAAGDTGDDVVVDVAASGEPLLWLGTTVDVAPLFRPPPQDTGESHVGLWDEPRYPTVERTKTARSLRALDSLHHEERILRVGWLWVCGTVEIDGSTKRLCTPLIARPVHLTSNLGAYTIKPAGEPELVLTTSQRTSAIENPVFYEPVLGDDPSPALLARLPRLRAWVQQVVAAAGLPAITEYLGGGVRPEEAARRPGPVAVVGAAVYVDRAAQPGTRAGALLEWSAVKGIEDTSFAAIYGLRPPRGPGPEEHRDVPQPLPLTAAQDEVVRRSRRDELVCVSGAPGNGKSHLVAAVAVDAVARGESVLVATPTPYAADVLAALLHREPGPEPVAFGEGEARDRMIRLLDGLVAATTSDAEIERRRAIVAERRRTYGQAESAVARAIEREARAERSQRTEARLPELRSSAPVAFERRADLAELTRLAAVAERNRGRLFGRWRERRLRRACGALPSVPLATLLEAVEAAGDVRADEAVDALGGTEIGASWDTLLVAEAELADAEGSLVDALARAESRWNGRGRRAVAALRSALPAGRRTRRDLLADIDAEALVRALPLWVGTLRDVEDLLPARPAMFDLVIVDEAAQVEQFRGAGALLRARRAVVVGDPRQLRHVSFVADLDVSVAVDAHGLGAIADRLDVRRLSLFDLAVGATPVSWLDEHFRCVPHLIAFSADRFYDGRVLVATRHPANETTDAIETVRVVGTAADEVKAALGAVEALVARGDRSIAVVSPFRAQTDALEQALLARYDPEEIDALGLRVGTAHSFQGGECDHLVISLGLAADDPVARWRFVEDPNLFNVLVTRARRTVTVVTSLPVGDTGRGLVAAYLRHADRPPVGPPAGAPSSPWVAGLATELARQGLLVRPEYPVGRWTVVLCAGTGRDAVALDCTPHPEGPAAHIARHRALRRAGWRVIDAFPSLWHGDPVTAAIELADLVRNQ